MMPKMDGIEATKILREMGYKGTVIALTANAIVGQAEMFMQNGFDGFISKPIDVRQLNATLNKMIRDKQPFEVIDAARRQKADRKAAQKTPPPAAPLTKEIFVRDVEMAAATLEMICKDEALKLEQAGQDRDIAVIIAETPKFIESLRKVSEKLRTDADEDIGFLHEKLRIVHKACKERDKQTAKAALVELKHKTWSRTTTDLLNAIVQNVLKDNFDEAASLVKNIETIASR